MKILFVDCDGVVNLDSTPLRHVPELNRYCCGIDKNLLQLLKVIVEKTDCRIVLTSTWRKKPSMLEYFKKNLEEAGILDHFEGCTLDFYPNNLSVKGRTDEIDQYLIKSSPEKYAIIDDANLHDIYYRANVLTMNNFFRINEKTGITAEDVEKIVAHLSCT